MPPRKDGSQWWCARVWVTVDGKPVRKFVPLETTDRGMARRKLAKLVGMIEAGEVVAEAATSVTAPETYRSFSLARHEQRKADGVTMAPDEQRNRERFIYPTLGPLPLARITDDHVRQALEAAKEHGLSEETVRKIRAVISRDLKQPRR
jgi:antitoxin (DNA-binding transcriptional repressor) of toxin-antitoxin stability system